MLTAAIFVAEPATGRPNGEFFPAGSADMSARGWAYGGSQAGIWALTGANIAARRGMKWGVWQDNISVRPLQGRTLSFRAFPQVSPSAPRSGWQLLDSFAVCLHQGVHPFLFIVQSGGHAGPPLRRHVRRDGTLNAEKRCRGRPACLPGVHGLAVLQHRPSLSGGSRVVGFKKRR